MHHIFHTVSTGAWFGFHENQECGVVGSRCSVVLEKKKRKKKKEKVRLRAATTGPVTSICPLLLYERQPPAQQHTGKMEDKLGGP